ncbi:hypothetical protein D3C87_1715710 [compost metagenome]
MYEYIDHVLANYLSAEAGHSEEEAIAILGAHIASNVELANAVRADMERALADGGYSWKDAFIRNDVITFEDEAQARAYAKKLLWTALFET